MRTTQWPDARWSLSPEWFLKLPSNRASVSSHNAGSAPAFWHSNAVASASSIVCGYVEMRTTSSGFGRRLPFTMLFARLCELTMGSPAPYARWNINGFRVDVLRGGEESERLSVEARSRGTRGSHGEDCTRTRCARSGGRFRRPLGRRRRGGPHRVHDANGHGVSSNGGRLGARGSLRWPRERLRALDAPLRDSGVHGMFHRLDRRSGFPQRREDLRQARSREREIPRSVRPERERGSGKTSVRALTPRRGDPG